MRVCWDIRHWWRQVYREAVGRGSSTPSRVADRALIEYVERANPLLSMAEQQFYASVCTKET